MKNPTTIPATQAYTIYVDSLCEGQVPIEFDAVGKPVLYPTLETAQRVIAEDVIDRLREYLAGEREFEDAIHPEEYVCPVEVLPDGSLQPVIE